MSAIDNDVNRNGRNGETATIIPESAELPISDPSATPTISPNASGGPGVRFATRADAKTAEGINKSKLLLLGGGLAVAVLFFVFTAVVGKSPKKSAPVKRETQSQQANQMQSAARKGSLTPLMDTPRVTNPDNDADQLGPADIRKTRSLDSDSGLKPPASKPAVAASLGAVPTFADTQQKWEDPAPYKTPPTSGPSATQQNTLKEPSLVFVRSLAQNPVATAPKIASNDDDAPRLQITPGTRIQAKLETQISSAVPAPVVAVVEYTYAIGDTIIIPAGARVYGELQQADRSGLVSVKFDEIERLDGAREKIDAIGTGLDLGPIKGDVFRKNRGKNFLVRAASGIGSVLAEVAGNNTSGAFSEDDMLRERLAENIGTAGDSAIMNLNANNRIVVSVPADTKIYVVFTKHEQTPSTLRRVTPTNQ